jgi:alpha-1,2-mannosyltransferase
VLNSRSVALTRVGWVAGTAVVVVALLVVVADQIPHFVLFGPFRRMCDLTVYRRAGGAVLNGTSIFARPHGALPFTYPPFAAILAVPFVRGSAQVVQIFWTLAQLAMLGVVIFLTARRTRPDFARETALAIAALFTLLMVFTQPIQLDIRFGQVNLLLMLLVFLDLMPKSTPWPRGVLIGVAAAIKLVPAIFVVYLLVTGRTRAAVTAIVSFLTCTALAWAVLPASSHDYWLHLIFVSRRTGRPTYWSNQSIFGILDRSMSMPMSTMIAIAIVVPLALFGFERARRAWRAGDDLTGMLLIGLLSIACSPVSWVHHLDWIAPVVAMLAVARARGRRRVVAVLVWLAFVLDLAHRGSLLALSNPAGVAHLLSVLLEDSYGLIVIALIFVIPTRNVAEALPPPASASTAEPVLEDTRVSVPSAR